MTDLTNILNIYTNNNYDKTGIDNLTKFNGFNQNIYLDPAHSGFSFIFITKPCLFLYPQKPSILDNSMNIAYENMCRDPRFSMFIANENMNQKDNIILKQLSYFEFNDSPSLFIPIFTNLAKSFTANDISLDTAPAFQTREGFNMLLPTSTTMSETAGNLSISVSETDNLDITKLISIWVNYIQNITNGTFTANDEMIKRNMLDYTCSIYYFVLGPDGRTLKYWSRYTGCYPINIPYSALSYQKGSVDAVNFDVNFAYTLKEDMNPRLLEDFNMVSLKIITPTFTNTNYEQFLLNTEEESILGYTPYATSNLLSKEKLSKGLYKDIINDPDRDPLIFYENGNSNGQISGQTNYKYVLSFGENTLANTYAQSLLKDESAFNYKELLDDFNNGGK